MVTAYNSWEWVMKGIIAHHETLLRYMNWRDAGRIVALGCNKRDLIERSSYPEQAYEMGCSL